MVFSLWLQMAMSSLCTELVGARRASCSAAYRRIFGDIVPGFDWFFRLLHQFEGDMLC